MSSGAPDDHRTRVGRERRARMRARLIEAATLVFAQRGPDAALIDHVTQQAGVSRGTFYNYFRSTDELLLAAKNALAAEMFGLVSEASDLTAPAALRLADGLKGFIDVAKRHPLLLDFTARLGLRDFGAGGLVPAISPEELTTAIAVDLPGGLTPQMAYDVIEASTLTLLLRLMAGQRVDIPQFVAAMLRMLGHPAPEAARIAARPFAPLEVPAASLISRSDHARRAGSPRA